LIDFSKDSAGGRQHARIMIAISDASRAFIDFRAGPIEVCDSRSIAIQAPSPSDGAGFSPRRAVLQSDAKNCQMTSSTTITSTT
jgi:hypothetical protein